MSRSTETLFGIWGRRLGSLIRLEYSRELTSEGTPTSCKFDLDWLERTDDRQMRLGREMVGMAHTHPSAKGWASPSTADLTAARHFSLAADGAPFVSVILSRHEPELFGQPERGWKTPHTSTVIVRFDAAGEIKTDVVELEIEPGWKL